MVSRDRGTNAWLFSLFLFSLECWSRIEWWPGWVFPLQLNLLEMTSQTLEASNSCQGDNHYPVPRVWRCNREHPVQADIFCFQVGGLFRKGWEVGLDGRCMSVCIGFEVSEACAISCLALSQPAFWGSECLHTTMLYSLMAIVFPPLRLCSNPMKLQDPNQIFSFKCCSTWSHLT